MLGHFEPIHLDVRDPDVQGLPKESLWRAMRQLWCRHVRTIITPRTEGMPAHVVCQECGWREPAASSTPKAVRTWDSTRDEARYVRDKKRRTALELQRQSVASEIASSEARPARPRRVREGNVVQMKRA